MYSVEEQMNKKNTVNLVEEFRKQFINEDLPTSLYHYTSIECFKSIIYSREIWATAANDLFSDPTEITIAKTIALEALEERKKDFNGKEDLYGYCKTTLENADAFKEDQFVFSFTEKGDLLSQWRAYCPEEGVSIGFSVPKICVNNQYLYIKDGSCHNSYYVHENYIYKCIYKPQEQRQKMKELFDFLIKRNEDLRILKSFFWNMIRTFSYSFKHKSFKEEKEWRLCCFTSSDYGQIKYRVKDSMSIPYLPFLAVDDKDCSIIRSIKIGPSCDKENLKISISSYLKDSGYHPGKDIGVSVTETPYAKSIN